MKIGFVGLGHMGREIALNLIKANYDLTVYDVSKEAINKLVKEGAKGAKSVHEVAEGADAICTSLPGPIEVEAVVLGMNGTLSTQKRGGIYIDFSSNSPLSIKKINSMAKEKEIGVIDSPLAAGGPPEVANKTITAVVGAEKNVLEKGRKIIEATTGKIVHIGDVGSGMSLKLINNMAGGIMWNLYAECLGLATKYDVPLNIVIERITALSYIYKWVSSKALTGDIENANFTIDLMCKDMDLALNMAKVGNIPVPLAAAVQQKLIDAKARGWGSKDISGIILTYEDYLDKKIRLNR